MPNELVVFGIFRKKFLTCKISYFLNDMQTMISLYKQSLVNFNIFFVLLLDWPPGGD